MSKKPPELPIDLCANKIEVNIAIKIKIDPTTGLWYVKDIKMSHEEFIPKSEAKSH